MMTIFLILAPYGAFAILMLVTSAAPSLFASAAICLAVVGLDVVRGRSVKLLGAGSAVVFAGLGAYLVFLDPHLSRSAVRLAVDIGVFAISFGSMLIRRPFTLQYALESVPPETAAMPGFLRANYIITGAWMTATVLMMAGNAAMIYVPGFPLWSSLLIAFAARNTAVFFTKWYPQHQKIKYAAPAAALPSAN
jgi:hypothetical protein